MAAMKAAVMSSTNSRSRNWSPPQTSKGSLSSTRARMSQAQSAAQPATPPIPYPDAATAEARREALPSIARLLPVAREAGIPVVHCLVQRRADGLGSNHNAKLFAITLPRTVVDPGGHAHERISRSRAA